MPQDSASIRRFGNLLRCRPLAFLELGVLDLELVDLVLLNSCDQAILELWLGVALLLRIARLCPEDIQLGHLGQESREVSLRLLRRAGRRSA